MHLALLMYIDNIFLLVFFKVKLFEATVVQ